MTALLPQIASPADLHKLSEAQLAQLRDSASLPDQPDRGWVDSWLHRSYLDFWASSR